MLEKPDDYLEVPNVENIGNQEREIKELISRLYGQKFTRNDLLELLKREYKWDRYRNTYERLRYYVTKFVENKYLTIVARGIKGRSKGHVYQETQYVETGDKQPVQRSIETKTNGKTPPSPEEQTC